MLSLLSRWQLRKCAHGRCDSAALVCLALAWLASPLVADDVHLTNGSVFEGVVARVSASHVTVELPIGEMKLPREQVSRVVRASSPLAEFRERRAQLLEDPASPPTAWLELARWAQLQGLERDSRETALLAARLAPELEGLAPLMTSAGYARDAELGWIPYADAMRRKGLVLYRGEWIEPAERRRRSAEDARERAALVRAMREETAARSSGSAESPAVPSDSPSANTSDNISDNTVALEAIRLARDVVSGQTVGQGAYFLPAYPYVIPRLPLSGSFERQVRTRAEESATGAGGGGVVRSPTQIDWDAVATRQPGSVIPLKEFRRQVRQD